MAADPYVACVAFIGGMAVGMALLAALLSSS